jgi:hypothetical protein
MKTKKMNASSRTHTQNTSCNTPKYLFGSLAAAALLPLAGSTVHAADTNSVAATPPPPPPSRLNALVDLTVTSHYLTPRGMDVVRQGIVFQPLMLVFGNVYKGDAKEDFLNDVTIVGGFWTCFATHKLPSSTSVGATRTGWIETDPIAGVSIGFAKNFKASVTYTAFDMGIYNIPFSQHLETKLSFDDSEYLKAFALHPYALYWQELDNKAVSSTDPNPTESHYFDTGISPGYTFKDFYGVKLEAPCRILMAAPSFYGTGKGGGTFISLYEIGLKASAPLPFMPQGYGHWSANLGVKYMNFCNPNLEATQNETGATVVYGGISCFF